MHKSWLKNNSSLELPKVEQKTIKTSNDTIKRTDQDNVLPYIGSKDTFACTS